MRSRLRSGIALVAALVAIGCIAASPASAAAPDLFWKVPEDGKAGGEAGRFSVPGGIAADPQSGHLFVADRGNARIVELTTWGGFVKAWGWGVIPGGASGTGNLAAGSTTVTSVLTTAKVFIIGQEISGAGIPTGTTITDIGIGTLTLSKPATATGTGVQFTSAEGAGNVPTNERQTVTIGGAPTGGSFTLTFMGGETAIGITNGSNQLSGAHTCCGVRYAGGAYHVGDAIGRPFKESGIPLGATITAIGADTLTLSANATRTGEMIVSAEETTASIPYNAPAAGAGSVQAALEALPAIGVGNVSVSGPAGGPYAVEFKGPLADTEVPQMRADGSALTPSGTASVATAQDGSVAPEVCAATCEAGRAGAGAGQLAGLSGVAVDSAGDVYVYETVPEASLIGEQSFRVQKFDPTGGFLAMWGGEVNKTKAAEGGSSEAERNLCTKAQVEAGDICGTGVPGTGKGQFQTTYAFGNRIAIGPTGSVFVGDVGRIQKFSTAGVQTGESKVPGVAISSLTIDGSGAFYAALSTPDGFVEHPDVHKLIPSGEGVTEAASFAAVNPQAIALDAAGNLYIVDRKGFAPSDKYKVFAYKPDGSVLVGFEEGFAESGNPLGGLASSESCGIPGADIYVSDVGGFVSSFGPAPLDVNACPPPKVAPAISKQFAIAADSESASVKAAINPQFWPDTRYYVEYGSGQCSSGGCPATQPLAPGTQLTTQVVKQILTSETVALSGLTPSTTYHYRFVAKSTGGGPVFGIDPDGAGAEEASFEKGLEGTFKTQAVVNKNEVDTCPNAAFRTGAAKRLPDCRAYEMVSPVDKENGDIITLDKVPTVPLSLNQSSVDGERLSFSSYRAFGDAQSAPISVTYLASRGAGGWGTHAISPTRGRNVWQIADSIESQFKAFSGDLCESWLISETDPPLSAGATPGYANVYQRENCGAGEGSYEALIPAADPLTKPANAKPEFQGVSGDGKHALFQVPAKLSADAIACTAPEDISSCKFQLYESQPGGGLSYVCVLPNETPAPGGCSAGSASGGNKNDGRDQMVHNAISEDGSRVFWSDAPVLNGKIYVRVDGTTTLAVSAGGEALSGGTQSQYWTAAADGSRAIFSTGGDLNSGSADLYEFALAGEETTPIAGKLYGLLGASEDAKRIYLVSGEVHSGGTVNKPNLYLYEGGPTPSFTYIATLASADASSNVAFSPLNITPRHHTAQVSADGKALAFMSIAPLTGFDNSDAQSGEPAAEVFHYDASSGQLRCVSCNPTGVLPSGRNIGGALELLAAAQIPITQTQLYSTPKVLSADGGRLYFESFEALSGADTNGKKDVYQWEALGEGPPQDPCEEASPSFNEATEGCVELISSGASKEDSSLVDISASGDDVFISTAASLVPQDPGLVDIYDARVLGGFPAPPQPRPPCEGEACQSPPAPPADLVPGSSTFRGPGNPASASRKRCPAGKRKVRRGGRSRCVAKKRKSSARKRASHNGRAAR